MITKYRILCVGTPQQGMPYSLQQPLCLRLFTGKASTGAGPTQHAPCSSILTSIGKGSSACQFWLCKNIFGSCSPATVTEADTAEVSDGSNSKVMPCSATGAAEKGDRGRLQLGEKHVTKAISPMRCLSRHPKTSSYWLLSPRLLEQFYGS